MPLSEKFCAKHLEKGAQLELERRRQAEKRRTLRKGTAARRGYGSKWRQARASFLKKHPLCVECLKNGRYVPATDVDHIVPHKGDKKLFWDRNNWQALCHECHARKTAKENGGFGNSVL